MTELHEWLFDEDGLIALITVHVAFLLWIIILWLFTTKKTVKDTLDLLRFFGISWLIWISTVVVLLISYALVAHFMR